MERLFQHPKGARWAGWALILSSIFSILLEYFHVVKFLLDYLNQKLIDQGFDAIPTGFVVYITFIDYFLIIAQIAFGLYLIMGARSAEKNKTL